MWEGLQDDNRLKTPPFMSHQLHGGLPSPSVVISKWFFLGFRSC